MAIEPHDESHELLRHPEVQNARAGRYLGIAVFAFALMIVACGLTVTHALAPTALLVVVAIIGFVVVIAQLVSLFRLDLSETYLWHTVVLLLTIPLFFVAITLTIWMFGALMMRVGTGIGV